MQVCVPPVCVPHADIYLPHSELINHIGWWGDKSSRTLHYSPFTPNRLMYFLAHLGERTTLRGLTESQLIGRSQFGEAWIREHHEVGGPGTFGI